MRRRRSRFRRRRSFGGRFKRRFRRGRRSRGLGGNRFGSWIRR